MAGFAEVAGSRRGGEVEWGAAVAGRRAGNAGWGWRGGRGWAGGIAAPGSCVGCEAMAGVRKAKRLVAGIVAPL